eukprot:g5637.t1
METLQRFLCNASGVDPDAIPAPPRFRPGADLRAHRAFYGAQRAARVRRGATRRRLLIATAVAACAAAAYGVASAAGADNGPSAAGTCPADGGMAHTGAAGKCPAGGKAHGAAPGGSCEAHRFHAAGTNPAAHGTSAAGTCPADERGTTPHGQSGGASAAPGPPHTGGGHGGGAGAAPHTGGGHDGDACAAPEPLHTGDGHDGDASAAPEPHHTGDGQGGDAGAAPGAKGLTTSMVLLRARVMAGGHSSNALTVAMPGTNPEKWLDKTCAPKPSGTCSSQAPRPPPCGGERRERLAQCLADTYPHVREGGRGRVSALVDTLDPTADGRA